MYPADSPLAGTPPRRRRCRAADVPRNRRYAFTVAPKVSMLESDDDRIESTTTEARAGAHEQNVRSVLMASLVGAILLMIVIAAVTFH